MKQTCPKGTCPLTSIVFPDPGRSMAIYFYKVWDPYGCFSNFSPHPIALHGHTWPTVEHFYQAQKFVGSPDADLIPAIHGAPSPEAAARLGRNPQRTLRRDWNRVKRSLMYDAVLTKFSTHEDIRAILLATEPEELIEDSPVDDYWGCGSDGNGANHLGRILMRVRSVLRSSLN